MFEQTESQGIDLMLAGHAHGGEAKLNVTSADLLASFLLLCTAHAVSRKYGPRLLFATHPSPTILRLL
jgi:predicted MPP superfamily phosphohydrolase